MEIKAIFGILSSFFILIGGIPYLIDIYHKKAHPHILSWIGWGLITALGAFAMLAEGGKWAVLILFANTLLCFSVAAYSIVKKVGIWQTSKADIIFFSIGLMGLVLWQTLQLPVIALVAAIIADFLFGLPTIIKTYKDPLSETYFVWLTATISGLLSLFAVQGFLFSEVAYPLYLLIFDTIVLSLVVRGLFFQVNDKIPHI